MNPRTILALDPGLRELGYAVLKGPRIVTSGVAALRLLPRGQRMREVQRLFRSWVRTYEPRALVLEATHGHPTPTFNSVHTLVARVRAMARRRRLPVASYAAQTVRAHVVGNGKAVKREVAIAIAARFPSLRVYVTQDRRWKERYWQNMFDAIALALHHQTQPPSRSRRSG